MDEHFDGTVALTQDLSDVAYTESTKESQR
jgi:hypothetical protein